MDRYTILFLIMLILCFVISTGLVSANDNITLNDNQTDTLNNNTYDDYTNLSNNNTEVNKSASFENKDNATLKYLIKNKEKYDEIVKKSTKKDRTFKIGKYKLTISKSHYKKFLYVKFIDKYVKSKKNITLLEDTFKIKIYNFIGVLGTCVQYFEFPYYSVIKKTNNVITQKIGTLKDYKTKKIYFKDYKKAKTFKKQSPHYHKIKYDKKLKKYYVNADIPIYKKIINKKARVYIKLQYLDNMYKLSTYTKYDRRHIIYEEVVRDYTIYKSSRNIQKLDKSKTKRVYNF